MISNEQIQALQAAIDAIPVTEWIFCERQSLSHAGGGFVSINGVEAVWYLNKAVGGMAHSMDVLRYIAAANPSAILSLLAERDADKALIAELERKNLATEAVALAMRDEMRKTLNVTLPESYYPDGDIDYPLAMSKDEVIDALKNACAAAGITLVVEE